jgi:hypothetical protein
MTVASAVDTLRMAREVLQCAMKVLLAVHKRTEGSPRYRKWVEDVRRVAFGACESLETRTRADLRSIRANLKRCRELAGGPDPDISPSPRRSDNGPHVVLRGPGEPARFGDQELPPLTPSQYAVVKALADAGKDGLLWGELNAKTGKKDARKTLDRLINKHPDSWGAVIETPKGAVGKGYRLC